MQQNRCPIDVISVCSASGEIRPLRFRMEDEAHQLLCVNIDEVMASSPEKATELFDAFDLSVLPHIVWTDENNIVRSCYVSLIGSKVMEMYPLMGDVH